MSRKAFLILTFALAGCATTPRLDALFGSGSAAFEVGAVQSIAPAPRPRAQDWSTFTVVHIDRTGSDTIEIAPKGAGLRGRFWNGCRWTRDADWFAPSDSWASCGTSKAWRSATAKVTKKGALWPLTVGASAEYVREARSRSTGAISRRTTRCSVVDAVNTRLSSGTIEPAYKVRCEDGRRVRTTWWSPTLGLLFYRQVHEKRGVEQFWERAL